MNAQNAIQRAAVPSSRAVSSFSYIESLCAGDAFAEEMNLRIVSGGLRGPWQSDWCCPLGASLMAVHGHVAPELMFPSENEAAESLGGSSDDWLEILRAIDALVEHPFSAALACAARLDERRRTAGGNEP